MARTILHKYNDVADNIKLDDFSDYKGEIIISYEEGNEGIYIKNNGEIKRVGGDISDNLKKELIDLINKEIAERQGVKVVPITSSEYDDLVNQDKVDENTCYMVYEEEENL
jgi:hypothetical protein